MKNATGEQRRWKFINVENEIFHKELEKIHFFIILMGIVIIAAMYDYIEYVITIIIGMNFILNLIGEIYARKKLIPDYEYLIIEYDKYVTIKISDEFPYERTVKIEKDNMLVKLDAKENKILLSDAHDNISIYAKLDVYKYFLNLSTK